MSQAKPWPRPFAHLNRACPRFHTPVAVGAAAILGASDAALAQQLGSTIGNFIKGNLPSDPDKAIYNLTTLAAGTGAAKGLSALAKNKELSAVLKGLVSKAAGPCAGCAGAEDIADPIPTSNQLGSKNVILDTNAVIQSRNASQLLKADETPIITQQVLDELNDLIARGQLDALPKLAYQLDVVPNVVDISTQAAVRQAVGAFTNTNGAIVDLNSIQGLTGDGIIGTTGILTDTPIITGDKAFYNALSSQNANVRYFQPTSQ